MVVFRATTGNVFGHTPLWEQYGTPHSASSMAHPTLRAVWHNNQNLSLVSLELSSDSLSASDVSSESEQSGPASSLPPAIS